MIDLSNFTHRASFYGVPCYFNVDTSDLAGRWWLCDYLIPVLAWIHNYFVEPFFGYGFPIKLKGEIEQSRIGLPLQKGLPD